MPKPQFAYEYIEQGRISDPEAPLIVEADGVTYTYANAARVIGDWSRWLAQESERRRVRVAGLLENTAVPHLLRVAAAHAGVVYTSLSPLLRGKTLLDALDRSGITDIVVPGDGDVLRQLGLDARVRDGRLVAHGSDDRGIAFTAPSASARARMAPPERWPRPCHTLVYTSGTSGPAKPVRLPAELMTCYGQMMFGDRRPTRPGGGYYSPWHPTHVLGAVALETAATRGLQLVLRRKFDRNAFWADVVEHRCRSTVLISVASSVLARRDTAPADHPLEIVGMSPVLTDYRAFEEAFGVEVVNIYGMTELGPVLTAGAPQDRQLVGTPSPQYRCRVLPLDGELPDIPGLMPGDQVGELAVAPIGPRSSYEPGTGPATAWEDGWFHTGDIVIGRNGAYRYVGRAKDTIRRHGRNISVHDLEQEVRGLPGVDDCACVSYSDPGGPEAAGEEDIRLFVVPDRPGAVDAAALVNALIERVPRFMVPRYVDILRELPKTPSGKLARGALRSLPLADGTYRRPHLEPLGAGGGAPRQANTG